MLPSAPPHVTILGSCAPEGGAALTHEQARQRLGRVAGAGPVAIRFTGLSAGNAADGTIPWNQSCVALVEETGALAELQRRARRAFLDEDELDEACAPVWAPPLERPHLSLAYGHAPDVLAHFAVPSPFEAAELAVWDCNPGTLEGVTRWREVARVVL